MSANKQGTFIQPWRQKLVTSLYQAQDKDLLDNSQKAIEQPPHVEDEELEVTERVVNLIPKPLSRLAEIHPVRTPDLFKRHIADGG